ncbi:MAG: UDP-N-acetylmuramate--L-alanine ligase [Clostridia bacterium]
MVVIGARAAADGTVPAHIHFIGIGGYSMSGLALALHAAGAIVSGSDQRRSERTLRLERAGIRVYYGHDADHVGEATEVVYSTDVPKDNPELMAARELGLYVRHRSEMLAHLIDDRRAICVTGTHGKTTTTSMIGAIMKEAGLEPLILVGADVTDFGSQNVYLGQGPWAVAEADESDGSFVRYHPEVAVIMNLEPEHLEHYGGRFSGVVRAVEAFVAQLAPGGIAVMSAEDPVLAGVRARSDTPVLTFGAGGDVEAAHVDLSPAGSEFEALWHRDSLGRFRLQIPGRHNVDNALAALLVARHLGISAAVVQRVLKGFQGARRRFEVVALKDGIRIVDDYAVHPTEIRATLQAARQVTRGRVLAVVQPHRTERVRNLFREFEEVLADADLTFVTDIYVPAGTAPPPDGPDGLAMRLAVAALSSHPGARIEYSGTVAATTERVAREMRPGDTVVALGAGDVSQLARDLGERVGCRASP